MFRAVIGCALVLTALLASVACADQEEGQRCDPANGNNDCASGLVCIRADRLALVEVGAICCPPPGQDENAVKECRAELQSGDGGSTILPIDPDAGGAAPADAGPDASP
jgi:hypothetical protein